MLMATAARSTFTSWLMETGLPAVLWPATLTVTVPAASAPTSAAGIAALQVPSASTEAAYVLPLTVTVSVVPTASPSLEPVTIRF